MLPRNWSWSSGKSKLHLVNVTLESAKYPEPRTSVYHKVDGILDISILDIELFLQAGRRKQYICLWPTMPQKTSCLALQTEWQGKGLELGLPCPPLHIVIALHTWLSCIWRRWRRWWRSWRSWVPHRLAVRISFDVCAITARHCCNLLE